MKQFFSIVRSDRSTERPSPSSDDSLGRGMDLALTLLVFLGLGALIDRWLGLFPLFSIVLTMFAAAGSFIRMKYVYDATMERHEAERLARMSGTATTTTTTTTTTATTERAA